MFDKTVLKIIKKKKIRKCESISGLGCECVSLWLWGITIVVATSPTQPNPTQLKGILVILILGEFNSYI